MHACDIRQYLICQNAFYTISPKFTLANNSSYIVLFISINTSFVNKLTILHVLST